MSKLIPNNRVITDSNSTEDFNLVEGIIYKIVHSKSSSNLYSNEEEVYSSSASNSSNSSNSYKYWSLRKANNDRYNLISLESGMNLDSNGQNVYISIPKNNSLNNPYQQWIFTKINDDKYNITHSKSRNLDSNGRDVYISSHENNSKVNPYQYWLFEPSNYNLTAEVMNFSFSPDLKDNLDQYKTQTRVNLLSDNFTFENHANVTIEQNIDRVVTKSNTYNLEIKKSNSFEVTKNIDFSFNFSEDIIKMLGINTNIKDGIKRMFHSNYEKKFRETISETVSYHINQKVIVPPLNSVKVKNTIDKISVRVPFKAKIRITGKADRLDENGKIVSMTDVEIDALRCYLRKENYGSKNIRVEGNSLIISTSGTLELEGYGSDIRIETIPIPQSNEIDEYITIS